MIRRLLLAGLCAGAVAQNPWVRKKKKDAPVEADAASQKADGADLSALHDMLSAGTGDDAANPYAGMGDMWEGLMDSPEMAQILADPDLLKKSIMNNPLISAIPGAKEQVEAIMASDAFNDPDQLQKAMRAGVDAMKSVSNDFGAAMGEQMKLAQEDPAAFQKQMAEAMSQFMGDGDPAQAMAQAQALFGGSEADPEYLKKLAEVPGMEKLADPAAMKASMEALAGMMGGGGDGKLADIPSGTPGLDEL